MVGVEACGSCPVPVVVAMVVVVARGVADVMRGKFAWSFIGHRNSFVRRSFGRMLRSDGRCSPVAV